MHTLFGRSFLFNKKTKKKVVPQSFVERQKKKSTSKTLPPNKEQVEDMEIQSIRSLRSQGRYKQALKRCTRFISNHPLIFKGYLQRAYVNLTLGNIEQAIHDLRYLRMNIKLPEFWKNIIIGDILVLSRDFCGAIEKYKQSTKVDGKNWYGYFMLGYTYHDIGRVKQSTECYRRALQFVTDDISRSITYNNIAVNYKTLGYHEKAFKFYDMAIKKDPQFVLALKNRANMYRQIKRDFLRAIGDYNKVIRISTDKKLLSESYTNRAIAYLRLGSSMGMKKYQDDMNYAERISSSNGNMYYYSVIKQSEIALERWSDDQKIMKEMVLKLNKCIEGDNVFVTTHLVQLYSQRAKCCRKIGDKIGFYRDANIRRQLLNENR